MVCSLRHCCDLVQPTATGVHYTTLIEQAHEDLDKAQGKLKHEQRFGSGMLKSVTIAVSQSLPQHNVTAVEDGEIEMARVKDKIVKEERGPALAGV